MKKRKGIFFGFTVLLAVIFSLASCDNGTTQLTWNDFFVDEYTHASLHWAIGAPGTGPAINSKSILRGEQYDAALAFLIRSSHYMFLERNMGPITLPPMLPWFPDGFVIPSHPKYVEGWVSAINGRPYSFPNDDPAETEKRYAVILSINPNGSINASLGAYWGVVTYEHHGDLSDIERTNAWGWRRSDRPQAFLYFGIGQTVNNIRDRQRATIVVDARGSYEYSGLNRTRYIFMEVRLTHNHRRHMNIPDIFYGLFPGGPVNSVRSMLNNAVGFQLMSAADFWALADDEARADYIASIPEEALAIVHNFGVDYQWFEIMQLVAVHENLRFFDGQPGDWWVPPAPAD